MKTATDWSSPKPVDDVTLAFPANVIGTLLPPWNEIPENYRDNGAFQRGRSGCGLASKIFFKGEEPGDIVFREGVDERAARRQLRACLGSYEPKHEHKIAGVGYLLDLFSGAIQP